MPIFFVDVRQDLVYAYGWPSWLVRPIWKVKRAPKLAYPSFRRFSCAIAHHFLVDPDSDIKNAKFFCGHPSRPCLGIRLAITACPTHLEGQTSPEASIPLISMIFVKRALERAYPSFRRFSCIPMSKLPNFFMDVHQNLVYASGWPSRPVGPILKVKRAPDRAYPSFRRFSCTIANHFLGYPDSDIKNAKFFCGRPSRPCLSIRLALTARPTHFQGPTSPGGSIPLISLIFPDSDVKNNKFFCGLPSRPCLCIRLAITARQTSPKRAYLSYRRFSCAIANHFLGDPDSDAKNSKFSCGRPSRPGLCIRLALTACLTHFEDLVYASGWPSRPVRPILKVKRAPERAHPSFRRFSCAIAHHFLGYLDSDVKNAKFFCGRLSRPWLCIRLALTARLTHFEGPTSPGASIPLISTIFIPSLCIRFALTARMIHFEGPTSPGASTPLISTIFVCYS
uniref:Uncharacterized protein n=1 Tax=Solanum lycopersicum TaxID=4081 RepID=A0A3Q7J2C7_SOLLC